MARENQGLQIALIVFVMLTILLGVTTYLGFKQYSDAAGNAARLTTENGKLGQEKSAKETDIKDLRKLIFGPAAPSPETSIEGTFNDDMKKWGVGYDEASLFYRPLLEKMKKTIDERSDELTGVKRELQTLNDQYKVREENKAPQLKKFEEERDKAAKDLAAEQTKFQGERARLNDEKTKLQQDLQKIRTEAKSDKEAVLADLDKEKALNKKLMDLIDEQARKIMIVTGEGQQIKATDGQVVFVNQREGTIWINLGQADSLQRQVNFAVYPAAMTNLTLKDKKGSVEVTQILGDHLAEARIVDDNPTNPIVRGDKVHTVLWSPGQQRHFALAGFFDLDGDGRSDLQMVLDLIKTNGGVVDAYIADSGKDKNKQQGEITVNTNYLILGDAPTEKGDPGQLTAFTKMLRDAAQLRIPTMQFGDMLQGMGWKNVSPVVRYGRGANPNDFSAKPGEGERRKSAGSVGNQFEKRNPPSTKAPPSAYQRF